MAEMEETMKKEISSSQKLQAMMTDEFASQLLRGAKIIDSFLPHGMENKSFVLIAFDEPIKYDKDDRKFYYRQYGVLNGKFYHATDYVKMRVKEVRKRAWGNR